MREVLFATVQWLLISPIVFMRRDGIDVRDLSPPDSRRIANIQIGLSWSNN